MLVVDNSRVNTVHGYGKIEVYDSYNDCMREGSQWLMTWLFHDVLEQLLFIYLV